MRSGVFGEVAARSAGTIEQASAVSTDSVSRTPRSKRKIARIEEDSLGYRAAKRALDLLVSSVTLLVFSPVMIAIAIAIKVESRGPVFFGHVRLGKRGRPFRCLKFRSMRMGAERELLADPRLKRHYVDNDYKIPLEVDPRVTRVGRFLRKSSLDELPQLLNVLAGSMSLVGPRPIVREELHWYGERAGELLAVKPGITGVWQVQGRSRIGYPDRTKVELEAIRNRSFWRDLWILAKSVPAIITARGSL